MIVGSCMILQLQQLVELSRDWRGSFIHPEYFYFVAVVGHWRWPCDHWEQQPSGSTPSLIIQIVLSWGSPVAHLLGQVPCGLCPNCSGLGLESDLQPWVCMSSVSLSRSRNPTVQCVLWGHFIYIINLSCLNLRWSLFFIFISQLWNAFL